MGGLVGRAYLSRRGTEPDSVPSMQLITLGSPHSGSLSAWCLPGTHLKQMRPGSDWLRQLPTTCPVRAVSVYSMHDNLVVPLSAGALRGAIARRVARHWALKSAV